MVMKVLFVTTASQEGLEDMIIYGMKQVTNIELDMYPYTLDFQKSNVPSAIKDVGYKYVPIHYYHPNIMVKKAKSRIKFDPKKYDAIIVGALIKEGGANKLAFDLRKMDNLFFIDNREEPFIKKAVDYSKAYFKRERMKSFVSTSFLKRFGLPRYAPHSSYYFKLKGYYMASSIIKREDSLLIPKGYLLGDKRVKALTYPSFPFPEKESAEDKKYDISFIGNFYSNPFRGELIEWLIGFCKREGLKSFILNTKLPQNRIPLSKFDDVVQKSKIVVAPTGDAFDTPRYWELTSKGACVAAPITPLEIPNDFEDGKSVIRFGDFEEFGKKIFDVLEKESWGRIGKAAKAHFKKFHTPMKKAEYILDIAKDALNS